MKKALTLIFTFLVLLSLSTAATSSDNYQNYLESGNWYMFRNTIDSCEPNSACTTGDSLTATMEDDGVLRIDSGSTGFCGVGGRKIIDTLPENAEKLVFSSRAYMDNWGHNYPIGFRINGEFKKKFGKDNSQEKTWDWATHEIDVSPYAGQQATMSFVIGDQSQRYCNMGDHENRFFVKDVRVETGSEETAPEDTTSEKTAEIKDVEFDQINGNRRVKVYVKNTGSDNIKGTLDVSTENKDGAKNLEVGPGWTVTKTFEFGSLESGELEVAFTTEDGEVLDQGAFDIRSRNREGINARPENQEREPPEVFIEDLKYMKAGTENLRDDYLHLELSFKNQPPVNVATRVTTPMGEQDTVYPLNYPGIAKIEGLYQDSQGNFKHPGRGSHEFIVEVRGVEEQDTVLTGIPDDVTSVTVQINQDGPDSGDGSTGTTLQLTGGWNMVSSPGGMKISDITDDCDLGKYQGKTSWQYSGSWNHKNQIPSTQGAFIWARESCTAEITDSPVNSNAGKTLKQGWNIISVPRPMTLNEIGGCEFQDYKGAPVWHYREGDGWQRIGRSVNDLRPTRGYYVYVDSACNMAFNGSAPSGGFFKGLTGWLN